MDEELSISDVEHTHRVRRRRMVLRLRLTAIALLLGGYIGYLVSEWPESQGVTGLQAVVVLAGMLGLIEVWRSLNAVDISDLPNKPLQRTALRAAAERRSR